jgi:hypothetical protein
MSLRVFQRKGRPRYSRRRSTHIAAFVFMAMIGLSVAVSAQQLEPRAYSPTPVDVNFAGTFYLHATGGASVDASLPVKNTRVVNELVGVYYSRTFDLLGRQASAGFVLPYAWESGSATVESGVQSQQRTAQRSGPADPAFRFATNLIGGPALSPKEFFEHTPTTALGASLAVVAPFGQYYADRLLNIGANRWAFKPELGLSQPVGPWQLELSGGAWLFGDNPHYFGRARREQDPIVTTQAHVGYNFRRGFWIAADATYYAGGQSTVNGVRNDDRQEATRIGLTLSVPIAEGYSLKFAWSDTVATRLSGSGFTTYTAAFQVTWW